MSNPLGVIAEGFLPAGKTVGQVSTTISGASAVSDGAGTWLVTILAPWAGIADSDIILETFLGTGTNPTGGMSIGIGASGPGVYAFNVYRNSTGLQVDANIYFAVRLRR